MATHERGVTPPEVTSAEVGHRATSGFAWLLAQTLLLKIVAVAGQLVLAWLLNEEDFGAIGLALTTLAFVGFLQQAGVREVLVHRANQFERWATPAFWLSLSCGVIAMLLMLAAAPKLGSVYENPTLPWLIAILSLTAPLNSLATIPTSMLQHRMNFRGQALATVVSGLTLTGTTILLAALSFGPYSAIISYPLSAGARALVLWRLSPCRIGLHPQFKSWRLLFGDNLPMLASGLFVTVTLHGDYLILGLARDVAEVGLYYFAFNFSMQTVQIMTVNLASVLFPALNRFQNDPPRQVAAFIKASRLLAFVGVPLCSFQAVIAKPILLMLFGEKWISATPILQLLSIAMALLIVGAQWPSLMHSQGRFFAYFVMMGCSAFCFIVAVFIGAFNGGAIGAAIGVIVAYAISGLAGFYFAIRGQASEIGSILHVYVGPIVVGVVIGVAVLPLQLLPVHSRLDNAIIILLGSITSTVLFIATMRLGFRAVYREAEERAKGILSRFKRTKTSPL